MKLISILLGLAISIAAPIPAIADGKSIIRAVKQGYPDPRTKWGYAKVRGLSRAGRLSQKFELRHGDCGSDDGWSDCTNDRQRTERAENPKDRIQRVGKATWYGWSIFLSPDFRDITPSNTTLGQVKMTGWREPMWMMLSKHGKFFVNFPDKSDCSFGKTSQWRGRWVDVVIFADYGLQPTGNDMFALWVDDRKVCSRKRPFVTRQMVNGSKGSLYLKYGIYNSYVSRWLNANKRKKVTATGFADKHNKSGLVVKSATNAPFAYDWGVALPTQIVFYDEMRYGKTRADVDVRMLEQQGARPVD